MFFLRGINILCISYMLSEREQGESEPLTMRTSRATSRPSPHLESCVGRRLGMGGAGKLGTGEDSQKGKDTKK